MIEASPLKRHSDKVQKMGKANPSRKKAVSQQRLERAKLTNAPGPSINIDNDFQGWLLDQAAALRDRRYPSLDLEHLAEDRDRVNDLLRDSGTLRAEFETLKIEGYGRARKRAGLAIEPNQAPIGPEQCPWSAEQILNDEFFPASRSG